MQRGVVSFARHPLLFQLYIQGECTRPGIAGHQVLAYDQPVHAFAGNGITKAAAKRAIGFATGKDDLGKTDISFRIVGHQAGNKFTSPADDYGTGIGPLGKIPACAHGTGISFEVNHQRSGCSACIHCRFLYRFCNFFGC